MPSVTATTLSVSFSEVEARSGRIVLQQMRKAFNGKGALECRCFCNEAVQYTATTGRVERGNRYPQQITESISFSNSASATLGTPGAQEVAIQQSILMRSVTRGGRTTIEPVSVSLIYDAETDSVVTSDDLPVYGKASVTYKAIYEMFYFYPIIQNIPWGGVTIGLGTVFAYTNSTVETLDMELDFSSSKDWVEYARVTSKIVLDPKGTWEFPTNWEGTYQSNRDRVGEQRSEYPPEGVFPYTAETVDGTNCFVDTRVHCIIEVNSIGQLQYKDHNNGGDGYWAWYSPYFGSSTYDPKYEILFADPPGGAKANSAEEFKYDLNNRTWRDVFLEVNKTAVIARLQREYPGATARSNTR